MPWLQSPAQSGQRSLCCSLARCSWWCRDGPRLPSHHWGCWVCTPTGSSLVKWILFCHFTHLCYFFFCKFQWSFLPLFSGSVIGNKWRCIIQYKIAAGRLEIATTTDGVYVVWSLQCDLAAVTLAVAVGDTAQSSLWLGPCCCVLRCLLSGVISSLGTQPAELWCSRSCHMECVTALTPTRNWLLGSVCPAQGLGMWGEGIAEIMKIPAVSTIGDTDGN